MASEDLTAQIRDSYESLPYARYVHPTTHPARVAAAARLCGFEPSDPRTARILEIGCAGGTNLLGIAQSLPQSKCLGLDLVDSHIASAQELLGQCHLPNVEFCQQDIRNFRDDGEGFDYIIAHGVLSWVPDDVKQALLALCNTCLKPRGIAYLSYNCSAGWTLRHALRGMLLDLFGDLPAEPMAGRSRKLLTAMAGTWKPSSAHASWSQAAMAMAGSDPIVMQHDILEFVNNPMSLSDLLGLLPRHGLSYVGAADRPLGSCWTLPPPLRQTMEECDLTPLECEQVADFVRQTAHRCSLVAHTDAVQRISIRNVVETLALSSSLKLRPGARPAASAEYVAENRTVVHIEDPLTNAFVAELSLRDPMPVPFERAATAATAKVHPSADAAGIAVHREHLRTAAYNMIGPQFITASAIAFPTGEGDLPPQPVLSPFNRVLAARESRVISPLLNEYPLTKAQAELMSRLDGKLRVSDILDTPPGQARTLLEHFWLRGMLGA